MDERSKLLYEFAEKEKKLGLFNIIIDGIYVYGFICRELRQKYMNYSIPSKDDGKIKITPKSGIKYTIISFLQLLKLSLFKKNIDNFIYSFFRVDKVNDIYIDKFTDPLIDHSSINKSYIIFEKSNNYEHKKPRLHNSKVIYTDYIEQKAIKYAKKNKAGFIKSHKEELEILWEKLDELMEGVSYSKEWTVIRLLRDKSMMSFYHKFFVSHQVKHFIAPCRSVFYPQMYVCKELGIPVFELQHGINKILSITYYRYLDSHFNPDYFLSFEDLKHSERYGIDEDKVVNIGWALSDYIKDKLSDLDKKKNQVLVISIDERINSLFKFLGVLAETFSSVEFHVRLHPLAYMTELARTIVKEHNNILLLDNSINIAVELNKYEMVIGDNSTVMSEALCYGKKIGRINCEDMIPKYYYEEEKDAEWEISDCASFKTFMEAEPKGNNDLQFYSKFNREVLESLLR